MNDTEESPEAETTFEQALDRLEQIVASLEDGSFGLEESMKQFEEGMGLLRQCHTKLAHAEQRIEMLTRADSDDQTIETVPFETAATIDHSRAGKNSTDVGDVETTDSASDSSGGKDESGSLF